MKNDTRVRIPKKYESMIEELYKDSDGYWCYTAEGYYASGMDGYDVCHTIHEDTVKELLNQIRQIKPLAKDNYYNIQFNKDEKHYGTMEIDAKTEEEALQQFKAKWGNCKIKNIYCVPKQN